MIKWISCKSNWLPSNSNLKAQVSAIHLYLSLFLSFFLSPFPFFLSFSLLSLSRVLPLTHLIQSTASSGADQGAATNRLEDELQKIRDNLGRQLEESKAHAEKDRNEIKQKFERELQAANAKSDQESKLRLDAESKVIDLQGEVKELSQKIQNSGESEKKKVKQLEEKLARQEADNAKLEKEVGELESKLSAATASQGTATHPLLHST